MNEDFNKPTRKQTQAKLHDDVQTVLTDARELMRQAGGEAGQSYKDARKRLEGSVEAAALQLTAFKESALETVREAGDSADTYVRQHPWEAIGIGAGLGLLLGILIARR